VHFDDIGAVNNAGTAHLFDATTGLRVKTFSNPTPTASDFFGNSVALSGNNILIGERRGNAGAILGAGTAHLFDAATCDVADTTPGDTICDVPQLTFSNPAPTLGDGFGFSVSISGDNVLIGTPNEDPAGLPFAGTTYLFDVTTGALKQTLLNPTPVDFSLFGWSVAISGNNVLVGATNQDVGAVNDAGAAYLFDLDITWVGGASGLWSVASNWSGGVTPAGTDTIIIDGAITVTLDIPFTLTTGTLTIENGSELIIGTGGSLTNDSTNTVTINGLVTVNNGQTLTNSATGTIVITATGTLTNNAGGTINNDGTITLSNTGGNGIIYCSNVLICRTD